MKRIVSIVITLSLIWSAALAGDLTLEAAAGLGSPYTPFSSKWMGSVNNGGLYHREFTFRSSYDLNSWIAFSGTIGWLKNRGTERYNIISPALPIYDYHFDYPIQEVTYFIPSLKISRNIIRVDLGAVIYSQTIQNNYDHLFGYPFNGTHRFKTSLGLELGEQSLYIFARFLDSFPLYSSGLASIGVGGRIGGLYEQQVSLFGGPYEVDGLGYRGEFRVYRQTAISIGFSIGGSDRENIYLMSVGLKTII